MRHNVAISTLLVCLMGFSAADETKEIILRQGPGREIGPNVVVTFTGLTSSPIEWYTTSTVYFTADNVHVNFVRLKEYNETGSPDGHDDRSLTEARTDQQSTSTPALSTSDLGLSHLLPRGDLLLYNGRIVANWGDDLSDHLEQRLYLECGWSNSSVSGSSASRLFVIREQNDQLDADKGLGIDAPARKEVINQIQSSPPSSTTTPAATSSTPATSQPTGTPGSGTSSSPAPNGLSRAGIIGVAVGVSVGGLLVAGTLAWLFCVRRRSRLNRRSNAATHHMMPSYSSDVGVRTMLPDKEMPTVLAASSSSPQSVYDGRPSADLYAPYSDRATAPPPPRGTTITTTTAAATTTGGTAPAPAPVPASAPADTNETDPAWNRGAPAPAPVIASRYAHLVEEGMTEDEIRRLEEEERQLDAAIEADRRGVS